MNNREHSLRVALVWNGTIYKEQVFTKTSDPVVTMGEHDDNVFSLSAPGLPDFFEVFERHQKGYTLRCTDKVGLTLHIGDNAYDICELIDDDRLVETGTVETEEGRATVYERTLHLGDWGVIDLGRVNIFFQAMESTDVVAGRKPRELFDGPLALLLIVALMLHVVFLVAAFLHPPQIGLEDIDHQNRFAHFEVDDITDHIEDDVVEEDAEQDSLQAGRTDDSPVDFDEPDDDIVEESDDVEAEFEVAEDVELDVDEIGVHDALDLDEMAQGAMGDLFNTTEDAPELAAGFGDDYEVDTGRNAGEGLGLRRGEGDGDGSHGTVGTVGRVDGDGRRAGAGLEARGERSPESIVEHSTAEVGNFCEPADIRRAVDRRANGIRHCFERQLQTDPSLSGSLTVNWRIELDGSAGNIRILESTMNNQAVENCIIHNVERMNFEEPDGGICDINYPFVFSGLD